MIPTLATVDTTSSHLFLALLGPFRCPGEEAAGVDAPLEPSDAAKAAGARVAEPARGLGDLLKLRLQGRIGDVVQQVLQPGLPVGIGLDMSSR